MKKLLGCRTSKARLNDNKLVLSLDNALTPVMWVIDMTTTPSFVLKIEENKDGYFALQKTSSDGKLLTTEDLAYYEKKGHAIDAMERAASALGQKNATPFINEKIIKLIVILAIIGGIVWGATDLASKVDFSTFVPKIELNMGGDTSPAPSNEAKKDKITSDNLNKMGEPLSADDFFKNQESNSGGAPFLF